MDENAGNSGNNRQNDDYDNNRNTFNNVTPLFPGNNNGTGRSTNGNTGAAAIRGSRTFVVLGWISAAFTAFVSPYFAIAGILMGVLANRQLKGSGNAVIITNIVLAAINIVFGLFLVMAIRRMMLGY